MKKKTVVLLNPVNQDVWFCKDYTETQTIDGVEYVKVFRENAPERQLLMRKDALKMKSYQYK